MALDIHAHRILILDFGSQYTQLIARRVREIGVYCELHPFDMDDEAIREFNPRGIILAGAVVENLRNIALSTTVTLLVPTERHANANGLVGTVGGLAFLVTSVLSGFSVGLLGMGWTLAIASGLTVVALVHLLALRIPEKDPERTEKAAFVDVRGAVAAISSRMAAGSRGSGIRVQRRSAGIDAGSGTAPVKAMRIPGRRASIARINAPSCEGSSPRSDRWISTSGPSPSGGAKP